MGNCCAGKEVPPNASSADPASPKAAKYANPAQAQDHADLYPAVVVRGQGAENDIFALLALDEGLRSLTPGGIDSMQVSQLLSMTGFCFPMAHGAASPWWPTAVLACMLACWHGPCPLVLHS